MPLHFPKIKSYDEGSSFSYHCDVTYKVNKWWQFWKPPFEIVEMKEKL